MRPLSRNDSAGSAVLGFKRTAGSPGFSLVEVTIAILVLGIGLVGLTHGLNTALRSSKESEVQTSAALLAAGRIETLRAEGFVENGTEEGDGSRGFSLYKWQQSITGTPIDGLHEVRVVIQNAKSGQDIYELRTLLFEAPSSSTDTPGPSQRNNQDRRRRDRRAR